MTCSTCHQDSKMLLGGRCHRCDTEGHRKHRETLASFVRLEAEYQRETGRDALADWSQFERWCRDPRR